MPQKRQQQEETSLLGRFFSSLGIAFAVAIGLILFFMLFLAVFIKITLND